MIMDSNELLTNMLDAFAYNRSAEHMMQLVSELHLRIYGRYVNWSEDGDVIYSMMVICFGEYGTSPRSGWFEEDAVKRTCTTRWTNIIPRSAQEICRYTLTICIYMVYYDYRGNSPAIKA